jgi:hypothetical protein
MTSRTMDMVDTLISKLEERIYRWIEAPRITEGSYLAQDRIDDYRHLMKVGGGNCPYTGKFIPPVES